MQTQTLETTAAKVLPYNDLADLIDREVHARTLEQINFLLFATDKEKVVELKQ
jgi:hypothetical protein